MYVCFYIILYNYNKYLRIKFINKFENNIDNVNCTCNIPPLTWISLSSKNGWSSTCIIPFVHSTSGLNTGIFLKFQMIEYPKKYYINFNKLKKFNF